MRRINIAAWILISVNSLTVELALADAPKFSEQMACVMGSLNTAIGIAPEIPPYRHLVNDSSSDFILPAEKMPWTAGYFAMDRNGIAKRWQGLKVFETQLLSEVDSHDLVARLKQAPRKSLDGLAATEKFDIALRQYQFPTTRMELTQRGTQRTPAPKYWEGFCNGVCAASILFREPKYPVSVTNEDGITVEFQPNDIKALAAASYFYVEKYAAINSPNRTEAEINLATIPNPGVFDFLLTQYLGKHFVSFVVDINPNPEIWNHVVIGYTRKLGPILAWPEGGDAPQGTRFIVDTRVTVRYAENVSDDASNRGTISALRALRKGYIVEKTYRYQLFLDQEQKVVGGVWPPETTMAPDLVWFPGGRGMDAEWGANSYLDFDKIEKLVNASHLMNSEIRLQD